MDVVSPCAVRKLEVYSENAYISWDGTPESIFAFNETTKQRVPVSLSEAAEHREGYSTFIVENAYKNEIRAFFETVEKGTEPVYGFEQDKKILDLIDVLGA